MPCFLNFLLTCWAEQAENPAAGWQTEVGFYPPESYLTVNTAANCTEIVKLNNTFTFPYATFSRL